MNRRDTIQTLVLVAIGGVAVWFLIRPRLDAGPGRGARDAPQAPGAPSVPGATPAPQAGSASGPTLAAGPSVSASVAAPRPDARRVTGRVVDADGGAPIGGARVVVVIAGGPGAAGSPDRTPSWLASDASRDGTFDVPFGETEVPAGATIELRVQEAGWRPWHATIADGASPASPIEPQTVRLVRLARDLVPGRVTCRLLDVEGSPIPGPVAVQGFDEFLSQLRRSATADAHGEFVLEGVPPGTWSLALGGDASRTDVDLAEGADARVELRTRTRHLPEPAFTDPSGLIAEFKDVRARARRLEDEAKIAPTAERRAEIARDLADAQRTFEALSREMRRALPHREVIFRGAPSGRRAWIAAPGDDGEWVVELRPAGADASGAGAAPGTIEARIPWMPVGTTRIEVRVLDAPDDAFSVEILEGKGPQVVVVPSR